MPSDKNIAEMFDKVDPTEHARSKEMWGGSHVLSNHEDYHVHANGGVRRSSISYPPVLAKCVDEVLVNAIDHGVEINRGASDRQLKMNKIDVAISEDGTITIRNNGQGIPTLWHEKSNMYIPELILGNMFSGRNLKDESKLVTGAGTNGIGAKLANLNSETFSVSIVYKKEANSYTKYTQTWQDEMRIRGDPKISDVKKATPFTEIKFKPKYSKWYKMRAGKMSKSQLSDITAMVRTRVFQASAFSNFYAGVKISFNEKPVEIGSMLDLARKYLPESEHYRVITGKEFKKEVILSIGPSGVKTKDNFRIVSNVNAVAIQGSKQINALRDTLVNRVRSELAAKFGIEKKKIQPAAVYKNCAIFINAQLPGVVWDGGQSKTGFDVDPKHLSDMTLPADGIKAACEKVSSIVSEYMLGSSNIVTNINSGSSSHRDGLIQKYEKAELAGKWTPERKKLGVYLLLAEGDSALGSCQNAMMKRVGGKPVLGRRRYGTYTFGGVIINVRKQITEYTDGTITFKKLTKKLEENKFFCDFLQITGLNLKYEYNPKSSTYDKEIREMKYDGFISCTDQDLDGVGKIFSLFAQMMEFLWPNLVRKGVVMRLQTPSRRAYPRNGGKVFEFDTEYDFNRWHEQNPTKHNKRHYKIKYVKGLATNSPAEMVHIFKNFEKRILTYTMDKDAAENCEIYFGKDAEKRKKVLRTPAIEPSEETQLETSRTRKVRLSDHLNFETKLQKLENVSKKLFNAIDGQNEVSRKIICGGYNLPEGKDVKISTLQSMITARVPYHHGPSSMQDTLFIKGFTGVGGVQLPLILINGDGCSRAYGGSKHGAPRYVEGRPHSALVKKLFPPEFMPLLEDRLEDGSVSEKKNLVPIIPLAICENYQVPADGWKAKYFARDVFSVINEARNRVLLDGEKIPYPYLPQYMRGFKGRTGYKNGTLFSFGECEVDIASREVKITELPLMKWYKSYKESIMARKAVLTKEGSRVEDNTVSKDIVRIIDTMRDNSSDEQIDIVVKISAPNNGVDPMDIIRGTNSTNASDAFESFFELGSPMDDQLNMIIEDGSVLQFDDYASIMDYWFGFAKSIYMKRMSRDILLASMRHKILEQHLRYIKNYRSLNLVGKSEEKCDEILRENNFIRYNVKNLKSIDKFSCADDEKIKKLVYEDGASYNYLYQTTDRDKQIKKQNEISAELEKLHNNLRDLERIAKIGKFPGAVLWRRDLDGLEKYVRDGIETNWLFGSDTRYQYD